ncbi:MAG TPA: site-specific integrase [Thermodesulfobacteriota bacterium]|nr:site-specific integrase [Thermodesulfobacteriota bacterium]
MGVLKRWISSKDGTKTPCWYIRYTVNGKEKWESIGKAGQITKTVAQQRLEERKRQVRLGQLDMIGAKIPTLSEFAEDYVKHIRDIKGNRSWQDALHKLKRLKDAFGSKKLSQISSSDIDDYKLKRLQDVKPATVNRELACLSHIFNLAKREKKFFGNNPVSEARLLPEHNQVERILTFEEEERLLALSNPYLKPIIITALNTGMRKNEILTLKWSNVDLDGNIITLEHTNTKSKKMRRIFINSILRKLLLEQKLRSGGSEFVFLSQEGRPYKRHDSLKGAFERLCKKAEITGFRFHDLRHTFATRAIELGISIVAVSRILGHADLKTTMRYAHPEDSLRDAVEKIGNFNQSCSKSCSNEKTES